MRWLGRMGMVGVLGVGGACGGAGPGSTDAAQVDALADAPIDVPVDPFVGMFDDPGQFPRTGCVAGDLVGFDRVEHWQLPALRTALEPGLVTYLATAESERVVPHMLTDDDLLIREVTAGPLGAQLDAVDVCAVDVDGTLRGSWAACVEGRPCRAIPFVAPPLRRLAGEGDGEHLALLGEFGGAPPWPGLTVNVRVVGDLAYLARGTDGLRIVDISDPAHPRERGHAVVANDNWNDVKLVEAGGRRFAIGATNVVQIVDVTDPDAPAVAAELPTSAHTVFVEGTTAYTATAFTGPVRAWDLRDPRAPQLLGETADYAVHDLYVAGGIAYLSDIMAGLRVVDLRDPVAPIELGLDAVPNHYWHSPWVTDVGGLPVILHGDEGAPGTLRILDGRIGAPTFLALLGEWALTRPDVSIHNVMGIGARAYAAHYQDGVRVLDLTDPSQPTPVAYFNTWIEHTGPAGVHGALGIDLDPARGRIYVADTVRGLIILGGDATVFP